MNTLKIPIVDDETDVRKSPASCLAADGPGIPRERQSRMFQKFVRVGDRESGASGRGPALCEEIVRARGGRIWIEPEPGRDSTFILALPKVFRELYMVYVKLCGGPGLRGGTVLRVDPAGVVGNASPEGCVSGTMHCLERTAGGGVSTVAVVPGGSALARRFVLPDLAALLKRPGRVRRMGAVVPQRQQAQCGRFLNPRRDA